jgi:hypothetical protein
MLGTLALLGLAACSGQGGGGGNDAGAPVTDNSHCQHAIKVAFSGNKLKIRGSTAGVSNEFGNQVTCGQTNQPLLGGQRYYSADLEQGQSYAIQLTPLYYLARLAIFRQTCEPMEINANCSSMVGLGMVSHTTFHGQTYYGVFTAAQSGPYILAVDATTFSPDASGAFVLTLEKTTLTENGQCAKAKLLDLSTGQATVKGSTVGMENEFGQQIKCGGKADMDGPQVYYQLLLTPNQTYELVLETSFETQLVLFGSNCTAAAIEDDCASHGLTGDIREIRSSGGTTLQFRASQALMTVAVDSLMELYAGAFTLKVGRHYPPANSTCSAAKSIDLTSASAVIQGDTTGAVNEFGGQVACALKDKTTLHGNQLYYRLNLTAGKTIEFVFKPAFGNAFMYLFSGACSAAAINADCGSEGKTGFVTGASIGGQSKVSFTPPTTGIYTLVVDTLKAPVEGKGYGSFAVEMKYGT